MLALLALAACDRVPDASAPLSTRTAPDARAASAAPADDRVPCARDGAPLERTCSVELRSGERGTVVTVRRSDGGFRRLLVTRDGRGVVAADGAEPAHVTVVDARTIEVAVAGDRYRLPATVRRP